MMKNKLLKILIIFLLISVAQLIGQEIQPEGSLIKVGVLRDFPPYYIIDEDGRPSGFAVEVMDEISEIAGLDIIYIIKDSWTEMNNALIAGKIDLICNQGITEARKEFFDFTIPVHVFPVSIFVLNENNDIHSLSDLVYKQVAAVKTNIGVSLLQGKDNIDTIIFDTPIEALYELLAGEVDALVYPEPIIVNYLFRMEMENNVRIIGEPLIIIKRAMAVKKGNEELINILNKEIQNFVRTSEFHSIYHKWFGEPEQYWNGFRIAIMAGIVLFALLIIIAIWRYISIHRLNKELSNSIKAKNETEKTIFNLSLFPDQNPNPVLQVSKTGAILYYNESCYHILNTKIAKSEQTIPKQWQGIVDRAIRTNIIQSEEIEHNKRIFALFFTPFPNSDCVNIYGLDITMRKLVETALRDSQERWNLALEGTEEGIWEWYIKTGKMSYNDHWMRLLGYEPDEVDTNYEWWKQSIDPENIPVLEKALND